MKSMTGLSVNMSNSVELASPVPTTSRANSMTAHWSPRHRPRYGMRCSRAKWAARTLPSMPRWPKPPGTRIPATPSSRSCRFSWVSASESTQRTLASTSCAQAAWRSASVTDRYASGSSMYLPTRAISTTGLGALIRATSARQRVEVGGDIRVTEPELADDQAGRGPRPRTSAGPRRSCRRSRPG